MSEKDDEALYFLHVGFNAVLGGIAGLFIGLTLGYVYSWLFVPPTEVGTLPETYGAIGGTVLGMIVALLRRKPESDSGH